MAVDSDQLREPSSVQNSSAVKVTATTAVTVKFVATLTVIVTASAATLTGEIAVARNKFYEKLHGSTSIPPERSTSTCNGSIASATAARSGIGVRYTVQELQVPALNLMK
ncbi:hypothetical protein O6P43_019287 [Quillaja saponaria]|uniref:Uncharacterized protein n=1 Tax=Quillaja saponaria TaxID=32244 RepID=A0AAD7LIA8_QUISA|nr:hypothetical protein O6P43_019287 [Quillaja saponaria]